MQAGNHVADATVTLFTILFLLQALVYQQRAVLMSERVLGIDHPNTITEYVSSQNTTNILTTFPEDIVLSSETVRPLCLDKVAGE